MNWPVRFFLILTLIGSSAIVDAKFSSAKPHEIYHQFKQISHLNTPENKQSLDTTLARIDSAEFQGFRAPFYAYAAKLNVNDGNWPKGQILLNKAIKSLDSTVEESLIIDTLDYVSWVYFNRGDYATAIYYVRKIADYGFVADKKRAQAIALNRLAISYLELGFNELAFDPLRAALKLARTTEDTNTEFLSLLYLINARIDYPQSDPQNTLKLIYTAESIKTTYNRNDGYLHRLKGIVFRQLSNMVQAKYWLKKSLEVATRENDVRLLRMINHELAVHYIAEDMPLIAKEYALESLKLSQDINNKSSTSGNYHILSQIYKMLDNDSQSLIYLTQYTDHITSHRNKNAIGLMTLMDKELASMDQQTQVVELENSVLASKLSAQKTANEQQNTVIFSLVLAFAFILLTIFYGIRNRMLSMKVALSMKDTLTGAYCRNYLSHYLPGAIARLNRLTHSELSFGVVLIDCDDFKLINERFGHVGGDRALKAISNSIGEQIRVNDSLFRWGGDEFVLLCERVSAQQLREIAQRLTHTIDQLSIDYEGGLISPTISVGYALHNPHNKFVLDELLKTADEYLYQTKRAGKNSYCGGE